MSFGDRLKQARVNKGFGVNQLASKSGVSGSQISRFESGKRTQPTLETAKKLAEALNISVNDLLENNDSKGNYFSLNDKEKNDIAIQAENLLEGIENGDNLNFYGEPATQDQKDRLLIAIRTAMEMNKKEAKKKFTPKKYRDKE